MRWSVRQRTQTPRSYAISYTCSSCIGSQAHRPCACLRRTLNLSRDFRLDLNPRCSQPKGNFHARIQIPHRLFGSSGRRWLRQPRLCTNRPQHAQPRSWRHQQPESCHRHAEPGRHPSCQETDSTNQGTGTVNQDRSTMTQGTGDMNQDRSMDERLAARADRN